MEERIEHGIGFIAGEWPLDPQKATILFIHGSIGSKMLWLDQVTALSKRINTPMCSRRAMPMETASSAIQIMR